MLEWQSLFSTLWVVWFFILFGGILIWTLRPTKRAEWRARGETILRDDETGER